MLTLLRTSAWVISLATIVGCSGGQSAPVHGKVTLQDGTPVKGAEVSFENVERHVRAWGKTAEDGSYRLMTLKPGDDAPLGDYKITVRHAMPMDSSQPEVKGPFDTRYESPGTSGLTYTVKPGDNTFDMVLDKLAK